MTKKKAIIYTIIFLVLVCTVQVWKTFYLANPSEKFNDMCKNVLAPSCQVYINQITAEKKYDETVLIQQERIRQNKQVLSFYKRKITNKCLLTMNAKDAHDSLIASADKKTTKKDYFLLKTSQITIQDITIDSLAVAQIQYKELKDAKAAVKTLKNAKKVLKQNEYMPEKDAAIEFIDKKIQEFAQ